MSENQELNLNDLAIASSMEEAPEIDGMYLSFWTDGQRFGVPIADVMQIVGMQEITSIPDSGFYVKGIINLRGSIIPIIDVRLRFGKPEREYDERTCIIVTSIEKVLIGFIVDAVDEVTTIEKENISEPPSMSGNRGSGYITGIGKTQEHLILLINTRKLIDEEEIVSLSELMANQI